MAAFAPPGDCPVCGEFVPAGRKSCPQCGSDERSGWSEETAYDALDLPDEAFADDGPASAKLSAGRRRHRLNLFWWLVGIVLLALLSWFLIRS